MACSAAHRAAIACPTPVCACAGLQELYRAISGRGGAEVLAQYLQKSPDAAELQAMWDAQLTVGLPDESSRVPARKIAGCMDNMHAYMQARHDGITAALLALLAAVLDVAAAALLPEPEQRAVQHLASAIITRRMKVADSSLEHSLFPYGGLAEGRHTRPTVRFVQAAPWPVA